MADNTLTSNQLANLNGGAQNTPEITVISAKPITPGSAGSPQTTSASAGNDAAESANSVQASNSKNTSAKINTPKYSPTPNRLHAYPSYTYNLTLFTLNLKDYEDLKKNPDGPLPPNRLLIASGGRFNDSSLIRSEHFKEDFYISKFEFDGLITPTAESISANMMPGTLTIVEPYGVTLFNRIINLAENVTKENFFLLPYLLVIEFFGYDEAGHTMKIPDITKKFPIQFVEMKLQISTKGAEYECSIMPFSAQVLNESISSVQTSMESRASSLEELFDPDSMEEVEQILQKKQQVRSTAAQQNLTLQQQNARVNTVRSKKSSNSKKSLKAAINNFFLAQVVDGKADLADEVMFVFHPDLLKKSKFVERAYLDNAKREMKDAKDDQQTKKTQLHDPANPRMGISIIQGTAISSIIDLAMTNSEYIYDQVLDVTTDDINKSKAIEWMNKPLMWYRIIPRISFIGWDEKRNCQARQAVFYVIPYVKYNSEKIEFPTGGPDGTVKNYEYIFTGKNNDIINFDLKFDNLARQISSLGPHTQTQGTGAPDKTLANPKVKSENATISKEEYELLLHKRMKGVAALKPAKVITSNKAGSTPNRDTKSENIKEVSQNLISKDIDLITMELKIVGDPDLIKQDDILYMPTGNISDTVTPNGSIVTDLGEVIVNLRFLTPNDYNDKGIADPKTSQYTIGVFSGQYQIINVKNIFSGGKFEQVLSLLRLSIQETNGVEQGAQPSTASRDAGPGAPSQTRGDQPTSPMGPPMGSVQSPDATGDPNVNADTIAQYAALRSSITNSPPIDVDLNASDNSTTLASLPTVSINDTSYI